MLEQKEQPSTAVGFAIILVVLAGLFWGMTSLFSWQKADSELDERAALIEKSRSDAASDRLRLPEGFEISPEDGFIYHAHVCTIVMKNRLEKDGWWSWSNSATDTAPAALKRRAEELGIDFGYDRVASFFHNALAALPRQMSERSASEGADFTFFVTTTSDTFGGLTKVLREYSCKVTSFNTIWFRERSSTLY